MEIQETSLSETKIPWQDLTDKQWWKIQPLSGRPEVEKTRGPTGKPIWVVTHRILDPNAKGGKRVEKVESHWDPTSFERGSRAISLEDGRWTEIPADLLRKYHGEECERRSREARKAGFGRNPRP